jgi:hypothetical protein
MQQRWPTFRQTTTIAFFVVLFASACVMPLQSDFWWHLRAGQEMWARHFIMLADEFSFTAAGSYWPNHEWLSEVLFFAVYRAGGLPGVTALAALCVTGAVALSWRLMHGEPTTKLLVMAAAMPSVVLVWTVRPHVFTLLLFMTVVHLVFSTRYWPLPLVFAVWANLHGGVALGLLALGAMTLADVWVSGPRAALRLAAVTVACAAATLATPLGTELWRTIPESMHKSMANGIMEWRPPIVMGWRDLSFWVAASGLLSAVIMRRRRIVSREDAALIAVSLAVLPLALRYSRNISPFILVAVPALSRLIARREPRTGNVPRRERFVLNATFVAICAVTCAVAVMAVWSAKAPRLGWMPMSEQVAAAIRACPGRLYNRFDDGGYVVWFAPATRVFVDNRQDPYQLPFLQDHLHSEQSGNYERVFEQYSIECAFLPPQSPTAQRLMSRGWAVTARDSRWVMLRQPDQRRASW